MKGKRGRGAFGKTAVFGIYKRNGQVQAEIVPGPKKPRCKPLFADMWCRTAQLFGRLGRLRWPCGYGLSSAFGRIAHGPRGRRTSMASGGFWGFAKSSLAKFRHEPADLLSAFERVQFWFNHRHDEVYEVL